MEKGKGKREKKKKKKERGRDAKGGPVRPREAGGPGRSRKVECNARLACVTGARLKRINHKLCSQCANGKFRNSTRV